MRNYQGQWLRHPKTTQERRRACNKEERKYIRGARKFRQLPDYYDDIIIYRSNKPCWKDIRLTQYRVVNMSPMFRLLL